jgi:hypothetical protein
MALASGIENGKGKRFMLGYSEKEQLLLETVRRFGFEKLATRAETCEAESRFDRKGFG